MGSAAARQVHVGVGADRARLPEALFVLFGVADRRAGAAPARRRRRHAGSCRAAAPGFRFIALADDNFYPVPLADLKMAARRADHGRLNKLQAIRDERFELMERLAMLPRT